MCAEGMCVFGVLGGHELSEASLYVSKSGAVKWIIMTSTP